MCDTAGPKEKKRSKIEYLETHHKCRCLRCGQIFFVDVGSVYDLLEVPPPPHRLKPNCPTCGLRAKLINDDFVRRGLNLHKARRGSFRTYTGPDCVCGQITAGVMSSSIGELTAHLLSLKLICRNLIRHWEKDWNKAVMPIQMKELQRALKEMDCVFREE